MNYTEKKIHSGRQHQRRRRKHNSAIRKIKLCSLLCISLILVLAFVYSKGSDTSGKGNGTDSSSVKPLRIADKSAADSSDVDTSSPKVPPKTNSEDTSWSLLLVNKWNPLPASYEITLTELSNGESVDSRIYPALQEMFNAARTQGVYPLAVSGYRTAGMQQALMDEKILAYEAEGYSPDDAVAKAEAWVAIPGTSEHQLGISVDINADTNYCSDQTVYDWLGENAHKFGFINRYPSDKTDITGVINEPWHYRYVGVAAEEIKKQGVCLEEYLK